jgi:archaellum component FlaC
MILPDISMDSNGLLRVRTVDIVDTRTGQRKPATLVDLVNIHVEDFENNFNKLIEDLKGKVKYDMDYEDALEAVKGPLDEFEKKYGITAQDLAGILILVLKMRDFMEKEITANRDVDEKVLKLALMPIDNVLSDIKEHFRYRVRERLQLAMYENALRLKQAEEMRKAVGSVATPGDKDGCLVGASASQ